MAEFEYRDDTRKGKRERADRKRVVWASKIMYVVSCLADELVAMGFSKKTAVRENLACYHKIIDQIVKTEPTEAHLIRQAAIIARKKIEEAMAGKGEQCQ